jgi:phage terminase large subunit-like protein
MSNRHKHADLIHAWAEGAEIQGRANDDCNWIDLHPTRLTWADNVEYRIKPEKKPDVVRYVVMMGQDDREVIVSTAAFKQNVISGKMWQIKIVRDGETGELISAEVLK